MNVFILVQLSDFCHLYFVRRNVTLEQYGKEEQEQEHEKENKRNY